MTDLLDIAPATAVEVVTHQRRRGASRCAVCTATISPPSPRRFPNLIALFAAAGDNVVSQLISSFGAAIGADHCRRLRSSRRRKGRSRSPAGLLVEDQLKLFKAIFWLTFPNGSRLVHGDDGESRDRAGEKQIKVKVRSKKSPSESPPSSGDGFPARLCNESDAAPDRTPSSI